MCEFEIVEVEEIVELAVEVDGMILGADGNWYADEIDEDGAYGL